MTAKLANNLFKEDQIFNEITMSEIIDSSFRIIFSLIDKMLKTIYYHKIIISFNEHQKGNKGIEIYSIVNQKVYIQLPELV
ncbi:MAG: hypothetical protein HZA05_02675 [Nitrospirae bacterium]|nr:hypothetical protein [Nitrospirota bacterium]